MMPTTNQPTRLHDAVVSVQYVHESLTKGGLRRFLIGAERTDGGDALADRYVSFATLNQWKAALADQARQQGFLLHVKYKDTAWFDADLLFVEKAS